MYEITHFYGTWQEIVINPNLFMYAWRKYGIKKVPLPSGKSININSWDIYLVYCRSVCPFSFC